MPALYRFIFPTLALLFAILLHGLGAQTPVPGDTSKLDGGVESSVESSDNDIRVLSLNLHTYQEKDSLLKLEQVATGAAALKADVLLLQEVGEHVSDPERPNAGEVLRKHLERLTSTAWHHEFREAHIGFKEYHEGISILSRAPLTDVKEFELSGGGLRRNALAAVTNIRGNAIRVCTAHTSWPDAGGDAEIDKLLQHLDNDPPADVLATIIGGDFNAISTDPQIARIAAAGYKDAAQYAGAEFHTIGNPPDRRIDYQFLKPLGDHTPFHIASVHPVFANNVLCNTSLPIVSDHIGLMVVYRAGTVTP